MLVQNLLESSVERWPDKTALIFGVRTTSYVQLEAMANRLANALRDQGIRRGERVVIYLDNRPETVVAMFAVLKADAVLVIANRATKERKLAYIAANCGAVAMISDARAVRSWQGPMLQMLPRLKLLVATDLPISGDQTTAANVLRWEALQEAFPAGRHHSGIPTSTSRPSSTRPGTTGEPKGVMADHASMTFATGAIARYLGNQRARMWCLNALSLSFNYGLYQVLTTFQVAGNAVLLEKSFVVPVADPEAYRGTSRDGVSGRPDHVRNTSATGPGPVRSVQPALLTNAAAALSPTTFGSFAESFRNVADLFDVRDDGTGSHVCTCRRSGSTPSRHRSAWPFPVRKSGSRTLRTALGPRSSRGTGRSRAAMSCWATGNLPRQPPPGFVRATAGRAAVLYREICSGLTRTAACTLWGARTTSSRAGARRSRRRRSRTSCTSSPVLPRRSWSGLPDPALGQAVKAVVVRSDPRSRRDHGARALQDGISRIS